MADGKGWDLTVRVEPAKEEKKKDEGGGDATWVIVAVLVGLLIWTLYSSGYLGHSHGRSSCPGNQQSAAHCDARTGSGHDRVDRDSGDDRRP